MFRKRKGKDKNPVQRDNNFKMGFQEIFLKKKDGIY